MLQRHAVLLVACLALPRCQCARTVSPGSDDAGPGGGASSSSGGTGGSSSSGSSGTTSSGGADAGFCSGSGPLLVGQADGGGVCGGDLAQVTFRYGICVCRDMALASVLTTDAWDSTQGPYQPGQLGGAVGVNGSFKNLAVSDIGGSLFAAEGVVPIGAHDFRGEMHTGGDAVAAGDIHVRHDAFVGGDIRGIRYVIDGDLHIPAASVVSLAAQAHAVIREPVSVPPPCACADQDIVDIQGFIAQHVTVNDNAAIGLQPDAWDNMIAEVDLSLPCGHYYLTRVHAGAAITLHATGRTALYIAGDLELAGVLEVKLDSPTAEMDIFVGGNIVSLGVVRFGSREAPSRVRTYVAGTGDIKLAGDLDFGGNLYAPRAAVKAAGPLDVYGALFARELIEAGTVTVHYDKAVLSAGDTCDDAPRTDAGIPPTACNRCQDCGNQACNAGVCGACAVSADCCAPLVCIDRECVPMSN